MAIESIPVTIKQGIIRGSLFAMLLLSLFSPTVSADKTEGDLGDPKMYSGTYKVVFFNDNALVSQGDMTLDTRDLTKITGTWGFAPVSQDNPPEGLYPIGQGTLEGRLENSRIIRLYFDASSDDTHLFGLVDSMPGQADSPRMEIRGHWSCTIWAEHATGAFQARQVN